MIFKEIDLSDIKTSRSVLNQLVDVIQEDISGSATRRAYQVFVTGGVGPGVTSSLFQTVYDQDFSLQTANPIADLTVGLFVSGSTAVTASGGGTADMQLDAAGKPLFPSQSLMMREKIDIYKQYAAALLGDSNKAFYTPFGSSTAADEVDAALFLSFKRLFARDSIKRETFAMRMYSSASDPAGSAGTMFANLDITTELGERIFTDFNASTNRRRTFGGEVADLVDASNTTQNVGLIFYDQGTVVLNVARAISSSQHVSGVISAMRAGSMAGHLDVASGQTLIGQASAGNVSAAYIPDFFVSGSIDNIIDHFASCRFQSGSLTAATFQNNTNINSTLVFCRAQAHQFNYSSNPTYVNNDNQIRVIDPGETDTQRSFSFITTVGLYDHDQNLLAVGKLSRPVEKNDEKDLTIRVRLDF